MLHCDNFFKFKKYAIAFLKGQLFEGCQSNYLWNNGKELFWSELLLIIIIKYFAVVVLSFKPLDSKNYCILKNNDLLYIRRLVDILEPLSQNIIF